MTGIRIAVAGEALIDLISSGNDRYEPCLGGAPYNLARALARQGVPTLFLNPFSNDRFGQALVNQLVRDGATRAQIEPVFAPTSLAVVNLNQHGHPDYAFYRQGVADRAITAMKLQSYCNTNPTLQIVCTGALALDPQDAPIYLPWLNAQRAAGRYIAIDANLRPSVIADLAAYRANVLSAFLHADLIKVSDEDLHHLELPGDSPVEKARHVLNHSPAQLVLLTMGEQGSILLTRDQQTLQAREQFPLTVKDTVGAGDSFLAGFLAALTQYLPRDRISAQGWGQDVMGALPLLMRHAVASASLCVEQQGCVPPNWSDVTAWVRNRPAEIL